MGFTYMESGDEATTFSHLVRRRSRSHLFIENPNKIPDGGELLLADLLPASVSALNEGKTFYVEPEDEV